MPSPAKLGGKFSRHEGGGRSKERSDNYIRIYVYIPGVDKILTRSPRDAAEFHYANSRRELPRKES